MVTHAHVVVLTLLALCHGCSSTTVREETALVTVETGLVAEQDLLDVDIRLFAPLSEPSFIRSEDENTPPATLLSLREAESHYLSRLLGETLQRGGHWGSVRLNPYGLSSADLEVTGSVVRSDGTSLGLQVEARDSRGKTWLSRYYQQKLDTAPAINSGMRTITFPFGSLLNTIANDLSLALDSAVQRGELTEIRNTSTISFAASIAPAVYAAYLRADGAVRLPAQDDPLFMRVQEMRTRNESFLDAIQQNYMVHIAQIAPDYLRFLDRSMQITRGVDEYFQQKEKPQRGKADAGPFRSVYSRALVTSNQPIEEVVAPLTIEFSDYTTQLNGSVENQFRQWEEILLEMYRLDTGTAPSAETPENPGC